MKSRLSEQTLKLLLDQINKEFASSALYLRMGSKLFDLGYDGAGHWMREQAKEELGHGMSIMNYVEARKGIVKSISFDDIPFDCQSLLSFFMKTYEHELFVRDSLCNIYDVAITEKDHQTTIFLQELINEQTEEIATAEALVDKMTIAADNVAATITIDYKLKKR